MRSPLEATETAVSHDTRDIPLTPDTQARIAAENAWYRACQLARGNPLLVLGGFIFASWLLVRIRNR